MANEMNKMSLRIYVDTTTRRVIFAEVGKEFVYLLYGILSLPLATVMKILDDSSLLGATGSFYESNKALDASYLKHGVFKETLLRYSPPIKLNNLALLLPQPELFFDRAREHYQCYLSGGCGYVKEMATYMVTDDLKVTPLSMKSVAALLAGFNMQSLDSLEEKTLDMGVTEAKEMLKASLRSDAPVLTSVFLHKEDDDTSNVKQERV